MNTGTEYRIKWRDGSVTENLTFEESDELVKSRPDDWASVQFMEHGTDCHPDNETRRKAAWGAKKKK